MSSRVSIGGIGGGIGGASIDGALRRSFVVGGAVAVSMWLSKSSSMIVPRSQKSQETYAGELDAAVTALGGGSALLDVKDTELTTGGLDDPRPVRGGVVSARPSLAGAPSGMDESVPSKWKRLLEGNSRVATAVSDSCHCCGVVVVVTGCFETVTGGEGG